MREVFKTVARGAALLVVCPALVSFAIRRMIIGPDRALEGSSQMLAIVPGLPGQYLRRAFLAQTLAECHHTAAICYGTIFSQTRARIGERVYIGAGCHLGWVRIDNDVLIASGVHITSGARTHGTEDASIPMRDQPGERSAVRIGAGSWVGSGAVVMADVGSNSIVGAGAVVTRAVPEFVVAGGVPARVLRSRKDDKPFTVDQPG